MDISFSGLKREYDQFEAQYTEIFKRVMRSGRMFQGPETERFEYKIAKYVGRKYAVAVGSGTDALFFALRAATLDEVTIPDLSFVASASCAVRAGIRPTFADVDEDGLLDWGQLHKEMLVYVHLYGYMSETSVVELNNHPYYSIEDAAQALGARCGNRMAGSLGDVSCVSFDPMKNLSSLTGGGVVLTDDPFIGAQVRSYRYHGRCSGFAQWGGNSQMGELAAAMLNFKLTHLDGWNQLRRNIANYYRTRFMAHPLIRLPTFPENEDAHVWHKFPIRVKMRDGLKEYLSSVGVPTKIHYPYALHQLHMFQYPDCGFENAVRISETSLSLPIHPFLSPTDLGYIAENVLTFFERSR